MNIKELIILIQGDKKKLNDWFDTFDNASPTILKWNILLGFPTDSNSISLMHKIRNKLANALSLQLGVTHLNKNIFLKTAELEFTELIKILEEVDNFKDDYKNSYSKLEKILNS